MRLLIIVCLGALSMCPQAFGAPGPPSCFTASTVPHLHTLSLHSVLWNLTPHFPPSQRCSPLLGLPPPSLASQLFFITCQHSADPC